MEKGRKGRKVLPPSPFTWTQPLPPAGFHGSVKVVQWWSHSTFYSLTLLISGLVRQPQCHISSGGPKIWKAVSNPLILPCTQAVTPGCAHKPQRRGDNSFPDSFLSKDRWSRDIWPVPPHPRHGCCGVQLHPSSSLPYGLCAPLSLYAGICFMQEAGERWGVWLSGAFLALFACLQRVPAVPAELEMPQPIYTSSSSKQAASKAARRIQRSQWGVFSPN